VLIEQHLPDDLLDRHPVGTGHAALLSSNREEVRRSSAPASAGTTFRPISTYTTLRDVTNRRPTTYHGHSIRGYLTLLQGDLVHSPYGFLRSLRRSGRPMFPWCSRAVDGRGEHAAARKS
jgi:hypothetical protein